MQRKSGIRSSASSVRCPWRFVGVLVSSLFFKKHSNTKISLEIDYVSPPPFMGSWTILGGWRRTWFRGRRVLLSSYRIATQLQMGRVMQRLQEWVVCTSCPPTQRKSHCYGGSGFRIRFVGTCPPLLILQGLSPTATLNLQVRLLKMTSSHRQSTYERKLHTTRMTISRQCTGSGKVLLRPLVLRLSFYVFKHFTSCSFVTFLSVIIFLVQSMLWRTFYHDAGISPMNKFCLTLICIFHRENYGAYVH